MKNLSRKVILLDKCSTALEGEMGNDKKKCHEIILFIIKYSVKFSENPNSKNEWRPSKRI